MEIKGTRPTTVVVEVICDGCGATTTRDTENGVHEFATLAADWGYDSSHDGEHYRYQLCEHCFFGVLAYLKEASRAEGLFDDNHPSAQLNPNRFDEPTERSSPASGYLLSARSFDAFQKRCEAAPEPNEALKQAAQLRLARIQSGEIQVVPKQVQGDDEEE